MELRHFLFRNHKLCLRGRLRMCSVTACFLCSCLLRVNTTTAAAPAAPGDGLPRPVPYVSNEVSGPHDAAGAALTALLERCGGKTARVSCQQQPRTWSLARPTPPHPLRSYAQYSMLLTPRP